jgi:methylmalonyl-CoA epimerase
MKLDHIGIAVESIEKSLKLFEQLGLMLAGTEEVPEQGVRVAILPAGESRIELLESADPEGPVAKFIARKGQGLHHIAIEVEDIARKLDELKRQGVALIDSEPRKGADNCLIAFVHPKSTGGVLLELTEHNDE